MRGGTTTRPGAGSARRLVAGSAAWLVARSTAGSTSVPPSSSCVDRSSRLVGVAGEERALFEVDAARGLAGPAGVASGADSSSVTSASSSASAGQGEAPGGAVGRVFVGLVAAIDGLAGLDVSAVSDVQVRDGLRAIQRAADRLAGLRAGWLAALDARGAGASEGSGSASTWVRNELRADPGDAKRQVETAKRVADSGRLKEAFTDGRVGQRHAEVIGASLERVGRATDDRQVLQRIESELVDSAEQVDPRTLARIARRLEMQADPQAANRGEAEANKQRFLRLRVRPDGMVGLKGLLPQDAGEALRTALEALSPPESPDVPREAWRSATQRHADALEELARRALNADVLPDKAGRRPNLNVVVDLQTLTDPDSGRPGELEFTGPVTGDTLERLGCDANVTRMVFNGASRPIDLGRTTRIVSRGMRALLVARDRGCRMCGAPPAWCEAHHAVWWRHGGTTDIGNLVLLCRACHRTVHSGHWTITIHHDNSVDFTRHDGTTRRRRPPP